ncbi:MAG: TetR/AcrR family transcriptional regulator [Rhodospirillales bacterium]|jgi:AcrR family transcriptional regulator|nr:TetR/AcrR family transcriptional regulator [Rhodospirillales bacterium]
MTQQRSSRPYSSAKREAKAAETRDRLVAAAAALLREPGGAALSLEAVAAAAGVTRLTVYNQFGSRRGLLEATFDALAETGGMADLASAMAIAEPRQALARLVAVFCKFWSSDDGLAGLFATAAIDAELAQGMAARNERRREALSVVVRRQGGRDEQAQRDAVDVLFALTSFAMFQLLRSGGRAPDAVCALLLPLCDQALRGDGRTSPSGVGLKVR